MLDVINRYLLGPSVSLALIVAGIYYNFKLKGFQLVRFPKMMGAIMKKQDRNGVSPFRALTLALAGTLGVGNIVGVSSAIYFGGFGSIFWMWISALCAMLLKYAEIVLAMRHRKFDGKGRPYGSAMLYIRDFFDSAGLSKVGKAIAGVFAFLCIINAFSMGSMIQVNAVASSFEGVFGISPAVTGGLLCVLTFFIIRGGSEVISRFTEKLVPLMTLGYVLLSIAVIILRRELLDDVVREIFSSAFSFRSASGGVLGFFLSRSLRYGVMRGLVSNEAGCGTAPTAHATSNSRNAAEQGFWGIVEVFVDTILLCTMTAFVVMLSYGDVEHFGENSIMMTISAYSSVLGNPAEYFLALSVLLFGFATVVCWAHYGSESCQYFTGRKKRTHMFYFLYAISVFLGAVINSGIIWEIADIAIGGMTLINICIICLMSREVKKETEEYFRLSL